MKTNSIFLKPNSVFRVLLIVAFFLILLNVEGQMIKYFTGHKSLYGFINLFYVDQEENIPALFSVILLLSASLLLTVITILKKKNAQYGVYHWGALALGFLYLASDEGCRIHEKFILPMRNIFSGLKGAFFQVAWVIPAIIVVLAIAVIFWKFFFRLPRKTKISFLVAAALYIGGAVLIEIVTAGYFISSIECFSYSMVSTIEELCEMAGVIVFIKALLIYIADNFKELHFQFGDDREGSK